MCYFNVWQVLWCSSALYTHLPKQKIESGSYSWCFRDIQHLPCCNAHIKTLAGDVELYTRHIVNYNRAFRIHNTFAYIWLFWKLHIGTHNIRYKICSVKISSLIVIVFTFNYSIKSKTYALKCGHAIHTFCSKNVRKLLLVKHYREVCFQILQFRKFCSWTKIIVCASSAESAKSPRCKWQLCRKEHSHPRWSRG